MKLCSYVITWDTGLAPNPFHGYCTNALCTPSHARAKLQPGDWLIGNSPKADGNRTVYAMRISEILDMDSYYRDRRFLAKQPKPLGTPEEQCGDNLYYLENGDWKRAPSHFHNTPTSFIKDIGTNRAGRPVFVAKHFCYFGDQRVAIPERLSRVIRYSPTGAQGVQYRDGHIVDDFVLWLEANHAPGIIGRPRDMEDKSEVLGTMITDCPDFGSSTARSRNYSSATARPRSGGCR